MASHRAINVSADDIKAVRGLAAGLLTLGAADPQIGWTDWEIDFLESMANRERDDPLSTRQVEVLSGLRDAAQRFTVVEGISVPRLIERCWQERLDLPTEDDQEFIDSLKNTGPRSVTRRQLGRLLYCCRQVGLIERHQGFSA